MVTVARPELRLIPFVFQCKWSNRVEAETVPGPCGLMCDLQIAEG